MIYLRNLITILIFEIKKKIFKKVRTHYTLKKILSKTYKEKKEFSFIQIGANDGVSFDDLFDFVSARNSKGIVVEPIKSYYNELKQNYENLPNVIPVNRAVSYKAEMLKIYKIDPEKSHKYPDWAKGIASFDKDHHKKTNINEEDIITEEVEAEHLMDIINKNFPGKLSDIDYFQIDTEGFDYDVIKMIDFKKIHPSIIKFENVNISNTKIMELNSLFKKENYIVFKEGNDTIAFDFKKVLV